MNGRTGTKGIAIASLAICLIGCARIESAARPRLLDASVARISYVDSIRGADLMSEPADPSLTLQSVACWTAAENSGRPRLVIDEPACVVSVPSDHRYD